MQIAITALPAFRILIFKVSLSNGLNSDWIPGVEGTVSERKARSIVKMNYTIASHVTKPGLLHEGVECQHRVSTTTHVEAAAFGCPPEPDLSERRGEARRRREQCSYRSATVFSIYEDFR